MLLFLLDFIKAMRYCLLEMEVNDIGKFKIERMVFNNDVKEVLNKMAKRSGIKVEYYDGFITFLSDEEKLLKDIYGEVEKLDDFCLDRLFKDSEVNNICGNYKGYYETVYNVYVNDINRVNEIINSYNQEYNENLEVYSSRLGSDYIDYNGDGVFLEREDM